MMVGNRVCHKDGSVGYIEEIDDDPRWPNATVRWQTPDNVPSCCSSLCDQASLTIVGDNVLPQPRSKAWKRKSREFCAFIEAVVKDAL